jgi:hypothetical protein
MRHLLPLLILGNWAPAPSQDTPADSKNMAIGWKFEVGQSRELAWNCVVEMDTTPPIEGWPSVNMSTQLNGTLSIDEVTDDGTGIGKLLLHRQVMKGMFQGKQLDLEIEESKLKKPDRIPPDDKAKEYLASRLAPLKVKISRRGNLEVTEPHPLWSTVAGPWSLMIGPILPWKKQVAVGDSWIGKLESADAKKEDRQPFDVEYTFSEMTELNGRPCARIVANTQQMRRMYGSEVTFTMKSSAVFDPGRGECVTELLTSEIQGTTPYAGKEHVTKGKCRIEFGVSPPKK